MPSSFICPIPGTVRTDSLIQSNIPKADESPPARFMSPFPIPHPISWEASPAGPALTCPQTASPHQAAGIAKCSATKQALPNTTDAEVAKEVGGRK